MNKSNNINNDTTTDIELKFTLPNKKVIFKPNIRNREYMGIKDHDGSFLFTGASREWCIFKDERGNYKDPLTSVERAYLEKLLNKNFNVLTEDNFWKTYVFKMRKTGYEMDSLKVELDLNKPYDFIAYKLLLTCPDVAKNWESRLKEPSYKWVLVEEDEMIQSSVTLGDMKRYCYVWMGDNEGKPKTMRDVLWLLNIPVDNNTTLNDLKKNLYDVIENNKRLNELYTFLKDDNLDTMILFIKLLKAKEIMIVQSKYRTKEGIDMGNTKDKVYEWLSDPINSVKVESMKDNLKKLNF